MAVYWINGFAIGMTLNGGIHFAMQGQPFWSVLNFAACALNVLILGAERFFARRGA